jgi:hypothetical protein
MYTNPDKDDMMLMYIPAMRRIRKMSTTDVQDSPGGGNNIYNDNEGWMQKLTPNMFPYKMRVLEEREFLLPSMTTKGEEYVKITENGQTLENLKLERRPTYVMELTQLDPSYVYSKKIMFVDMETFMFTFTENYDQKGRWWRFWNAMSYGWHPESGMISWHGMFNGGGDRIEKHGGVGLMQFQYPAFYERKDISLLGIARMSK